MNLPLPSRSLPLADSPGLEKGFVQRGRIGEVKLCPFASAQFFMPVFEGGTTEADAAFDQLLTNRWSVGSHLRHVHKPNVVARLQQIFVAVSLQCAMT